MTVYRHTFKLTVYTEDAVYLTRPAADLLKQIAYDIDGGDCIGALTHQGVEQVAGDELRQQLLAIGNDGTFFEEP